MVLNSLINTDKELRVPNLMAGRCAICTLGTDRERVLIAIKRNPRQTKASIIKSMHIIDGPKQREIFASLPVHFVNGSWQRKEPAAAAVAEEVARA